MYSIYSTTNSRQAEFLTEVGQPASMITGYIAREPLPEL